MIKAKLTLFVLLLFLLPNLALAMEYQLKGRYHSYSVKAPEGWIHDSDGKAANIPYAYEFIH